MLGFFVHHISTDKIRAAFQFHPATSVAAAAENAAAASAAAAAAIVVSARALGVITRGHSK